jgi:ubiquinone/menaquinone biosynthesis C-methylase UbiE
VDVTHKTGTEGTIGTRGFVLHRAAGYDLLVWLITHGRERAFRERLVDLAHLSSGETILDVGCGTGSLAMVAKQRVGPTGHVFGIDASPEMVARATRKARKRGVDVTFMKAFAETLPFADAHIDVVFSTVMLHHLSKTTRQQAAREIHRVLKPGGRILVVDFGRSEAKQHGIVSRFHRHGYVDATNIIATVGEAGLTVVEHGAVGMFDLNFVLASSCCAGSIRSNGRPKV